MSNTVSTHGRREDTKPTTNNTMVDETPAAAAAAAAAAAEPLCMVKLVSLDDCSFELPVKAAILSNLVKDMGDSGDNDDDNNDNEETIVFREPIDLVRVRGEVLEKVVDFLKHYHEEPMLEIQIPLQGSSLEEVSYIVLLLCITAQSNPHCCAYEITAGSRRVL